MHYTKLVKDEDGETGALPESFQPHQKWWGFFTSAMKTPFVSFRLARGGIKASGVLIVENAGLTAA